MSLDFTSTLDDSPFQRAIRRMDSESSKMAQKAIANFQRMGDGLSASFKGMLAGGAIAGGFATAFRGVSEYADNVNDLSEALRLTTDEFQRLSGVFGLGGVSGEKFAKGIGALNQSIQEARDGNERTVASFGRLGVSLKDLNSLSPDEILMKMSDGLASATDKSAALAAASDLVGKGQLRMINALSQGSAAIEEQAGRIKVASASNLAAVDALGDGFAVLKNNAMAAGTEGLGTFLKFANATLPGIVKVTEQLAKQSALYQDFQRLTTAAKLFAPEPATIPQLPPVGPGGAANSDMGGPNRLSPNAKSTGDAVGEMNRQRQFDEAMENLKRQSQATEQIEKHAERTAKIYRDLYKDGLNDAEKLAFLDRERAIIAKDLAKASGVERAALKEKLADKNAEWLAEKRIQQEKARQKKVQDIMDRQQKLQGKLDDDRGEQLNFEMSSPDERRQSIRDQRRRERAQGRINRVAESRRLRGGRDARPGSNELANNVTTDEDKLRSLAQMLAKEVALLVPK